jgi:hypothetical protein
MVIMSKSSVDSCAVCGEKDEGSLCSKPTTISLVYLMTNARSKSN